MSFDTSQLPVEDQHVLRSRAEQRSAWVRRAVVELGPGQHTDDDIAAAATRLLERETGLGPYELRLRGLFIDAREAERLRS